MEARTIGWSIAVLVIATFGFVAMFAIERETASRDLGLAKSALQESQHGLDAARNALDRMKTRVAEARKLQGSKKAMKEEAESIGGRVTAAERGLEDLKRAWTKEREAFEQAIAAGRQKIVGSKYEKLEANGQTLTKVSVKSFSGGILALEHSDGLARVPAAKMPEEFVAVLMPDWNPELTVPSLAEPKTDVADTAIPDEAVEPDSSPAPTPAPAAAAVPQGENPHTAGRSKAQTTRDNWMLKVDAVSGQLSLANARYYRLQSEYNNSRYRSRIVTEPAGLKEAKAAVEALQRQLETARHAYNRASLELRRLMTKEAEWTPPAQ